MKPKVTFIFLLLGASGCDRSDPEPTPVAPAAAEGESDSRADRGPAPDTPGAASTAPRASTSTPAAEVQGERAVLVGGQPTGYFLAESGALLRRTAQDCPSLIPRSAFECRQPKVGAAASHGACKKDADCTAEKNGHCERPGLSASCACQYGCRRDGECDKGEICVCADPVGYCAPSSCGASGLCDSGMCQAVPRATDVVDYGPFFCVQ